MTVHQIDITKETAVDAFSVGYEPIQSIESGDTVVVRSLDASGYLSRQQFPGDKPAAMFESARGHCLTGPIEVVGADTNDVLAVTFTSLEPGDWGWTVAGVLDNHLNRRLGVVEGEPVWILWELDWQKRSGANQLGLSVDLAPFLGVVGMPPQEPGEHSTIPPRSFGGGNIDCKELVAGSTLYLPVTVPGAMLCMGDGHALQADGEVGGTAIECPMTTTAVIEVVSDRPVKGIHAVTPSSRITFGFDENLNNAAADALDAMLDWMSAIYDLARPTALALASSVVDMRVTQVANQTWGVHAVLRNDALR